MITCIECSGIHRSLGVQISKVRSLTLDKWNPQLLALFCHLGNANVNAIFEASVPQGTSKPSSKADRDQREQWIRSKYLLRRFVASQTFPIPQKEIFSAVTADDPLRLLRVQALGLSIDQTSSEHKGRSPLLEAIAEERLQCVQFLALNGANALTVDDQGWNAFHHVRKVTLAHF